MAANQQWEEVLSGKYVYGNDGAGATVFQVNPNVWTGLAHFSKRSNPLDNYKTKEEAQKAALAEVEYIKKAVSL